MELRLRSNIQMAQRAPLYEAEVPGLPAPALVEQQSSVTRDVPANKPSQQILNLQRTLGNRAVQRLILNRKPDGQAEDSNSSVAVADTAVASNPAPKTGVPVETVPTNWFIDSWGVAGDRGRAGRRDSQPEDVLILDGLTIGFAPNTKTFERAGNALQSGRSRLGLFDHTKGPGDADGVVSYATQRDIYVDFKANTPPETGPLDKTAKAQKLANEKAVKGATEKMVLDLIRKKDSGVSGDWSEVEKQAAAAAAEQLPAGSTPTVKIDSKVKHDKFRLQTQSYRVEKPANCTVKIIVPTATTTYQVHGGESDTTTVSAGVAGSTKQSQKIDIGGEVKTFVQNTRSSFIQTVNSMHHKIASKGPGGTVESDDGPDLSWSERAKKWVKDKASGLWETAKDKIIGKATSFLKNKLSQWVIKGLELESYIEIKLAEWVVGGLVDKAVDKVKGWFVKTKRTPTEKPCGGSQTTSPVPSQPDPRTSQCPNCHDRHPDPHGVPPAPQPTGPITIRPPAPSYDPCPPESQPPLIKSDDSEIITIFSDSTNEIVTSASHADLEMKEEESQGGYVGVEATHHTEHYYSGSVTKETIGHPAIDVIVED